MNEPKLQRQYAFNYGFQECFLGNYLAENCLAELNFEDILYRSIPTQIKKSNSDVTYYKFDGCPIIKKNNTY